MDRRRSLLILLFQLIRYQKILPGTSIHFENKCVSFVIFSASRNRLDTMLHTASLFLINFAKHSEGGRCLIAFNT